MADENIHYLYEAPKADLWIDASAFTDSHSHSVYSYTLYTALLLC